MTQKKDTVTVYTPEMLAKLPDDVKKRIIEQTNASMKDVTARLPIIKISRETGQYIFPDDVLKSEFVGIILFSNITKSYWDIEFKGDGTPPRCASLDGIKPTQWEGDKPINNTCTGCHLNKFGTATNKDGESTKGKACRDIRRIHILINKEIFPYRLILPPTSLFNYDDFVTRSISTFGLPLSLLQVKFSTEKKESSGYKISVFKAEVIGNTFDSNQDKLIAALNKIERLQKEFDIAMHGQVIEADEAIHEEASSTDEPISEEEGAKSETDQAGLPF